ncbi:PIN domain-containing protein [Flagellimonas baculiformis]|uniref:PIN domain-containing protein n=1 Tax=Flagellimonas baculiformis TaxID=3067310 RepID=UPI00296F6254|nr:PIN domain-containing protein [Muricauda sp. D6]
MKVFVDANVLVAVLNRQYPLYAHAARILSLADSSKYKVFTSPICLAIAFYFAEKKSGTQKAAEKISILSHKLQIATADVSVVRKTVANPAIDDFEDGLEYYSALLSGCEIIVTEDVTDFYFSEIPVYDCRAFVRYVLENS